MSIVVGNVIVVGCVLPSQKEMRSMTWWEADLSNRACPSGIMDWHGTIRNNKYTYLFLEKAINGYTTLPCLERVAPFCGGGSTRDDGRIFQLFHLQVELRCIWLFFCITKLYNRKMKTPLLREPKRSQLSLTLHSRLFSSRFARGILHSDRL